jgi:NADH:ubiquinone oxidoreductase subunit 5 (subunit L)/multisubunit Na+/H+ antiporter MnhA subunit
MLLILGEVPAWGAWVLLGIGAVSGIPGILFALAQRDLKRLLAYSSGENMGIVALGLGLGLLGLHYQSPAVAALGFAGALLHVLNHALFKGLLFMGAGAVAQATGTRNMEQLGGLLKRMPLTGLAFFAGAAAICALPPLNGFVSEFLIFVASFQALLATGGVALGGLVVVVSLALIGGLALACFTKAFGVVFQGEPRTPAAAGATEAAASLTVPILLLAGLCLALGVGAVHVVRGLVPVVTQLAGTDAALLAATRVPAVLSGLFLVLIAGALAMAWVRRRLLAARSVRETVTWDCGYAAPAPSMQYTGASFVQPLTHGAQAILQAQSRQQDPVGIFPAAVSRTAEVPDVARRVFFDPLFRWVGAGLGWFRWVQEGRVHFYVLYIVVALLALLGWALWS